VRWEKVACWSTKAAILSLKRVKIEESLLWRSYRKELTNALSNGTIPTPYGLLFPKIGVRNPLPKTQKSNRYIRPISGTGEATDFKFCQNIHWVHLNKSPLQILEKREHGRIEGLPKFWGYNQLSQERVKLRTSHFVRTFIGSIGTKAR